MDRIKTHVAKKPGFPGYAAAYFFDPDFPGDSKELAKTILAWEKAGYQYVGPVSPSEWARGSGAFIRERDRRALRSGEKKGGEG